MIMSLKINKPNASSKRGVRDSSSESDSGPDGITDSVVDSTEEDSGEEEDMNVTSRAEFVKAYKKLTDAAQQLPVSTGSPEDRKRCTVSLGKNVDRGQYLTNMLEDPSDSVAALTHALAVVKAASVSVNNCGRTDANYFSVKKYLDYIKKTAASANRSLFNKDKANEVIRDFSMKNSGSVGNPLISLLGAVTVRSTSESLVAETGGKNPRTRTSKPAFDSVSLTQHEVVQGSNKKSFKDDAMQQSARKAVKLRDLCSQQENSTLSLVQYGIQGQTSSAKDFLKNVFEASVITRDGFAQVTFPGKKNTDAKLFVNIADSQTRIQPAEPPQEKATASESFDLNRFQQIVSFNASTIKKMLLMQAAK